MPLLLDAKAHDLDWTAIANVAHDVHWSKNRMWLARAGSYGRRLCPLARERRDRLADRLRAAIASQGVTVRQNRLLLAVNAAKADHRSDALNVIDLVADAVELATGLNDRWFEIAGLWWQIDPGHPSLTVIIGQADVANVAVCVACGLLLPLDRFKRPPAYQGTCLACAKQARAQARYRPPPEPVPNPDTARPPW